MTEKAMEIMKHCNITLLTYGPNAGKMSVRPKSTADGKRIAKELKAGMWKAEVDEIRMHLQNEEAVKQAAAKSRQEKINAIEGLQEIYDASEEWSRYRDAFSCMMDNQDNDGARPPMQPTVNIEALNAKYPRAAAYIKAENYSCAANYAKSSAGRKALEKIINGEDYAQAIADMETEWSAYCEEHIWD